MMPPAHGWVTLSRKKSFPEMDGAALAPQVSGSPVVILECVTPEELHDDAPRFSEILIQFPRQNEVAIIASIALDASMARVKRSAWPIVQARCIEHSLHKGRNMEGSVFWSLRLVCEINFAGTTYQVIPLVGWSDLSKSESVFWSEAKAQAFITQVISPNGKCKLRVNPKNPQEAQLLS